MERTAAMKAATRNRFIAVSALVGIFGFILNSIHALSPMTRYVGCLLAFFGFIPLALQATFKRFRSDDENPFQPSFGCAGRTPGFAYLMSTRMRR